MFGQALNPIIRADGSPKFAMLSTLAGTAANIILDPIFIFGFHWGMVGAAVATVIGQIITAVLAGWYLVHAKIIKPKELDFKPNFKIFARTLSLGLCSFLAQISLVAAMMAINNMIRQYSALDEIFGQPQYTQIPMAVVGIVMKFFVFGVGFALLLPRFFALNGVLYSMPESDLLTAIISGIIIVKTYRQLNQSIKITKN